MHVCMYGERYSSTNISHVGETSVSICYRLGRESHLAEGKDLSYLCMYVARYVCMYVQAERRVASDLEAAEKRTIALREDAAVVKPEWVGNLVFSRAKYLSPGGLVCYLLFSCIFSFMYVCMYRRRASVTVQCGFVYAER